MSTTVIAHDMSTNPGLDLRETWLFTNSAGGAAFDVGTATIALYDRTGAVTTVATVTIGQPTVGTVTVTLPAAQALLLYQAGKGAYRYEVNFTISGVPSFGIAGVLQIMDPGYSISSSGTTAFTANVSGTSVAVAVAVAANTASAVTFTPTITNPATTVQAAIARTRSVILPQIVNAYATGTNTRAAGQNSSYNVVGFDTVNTISGVAAPYCIDANNGFLRLCLTFDANGAPATWSNAKGFPAGTQWFNGARVVTFKGNLYYLTIEDASGLPAIYQATPTSGNTALTWTKVLTGTAGSGSQTPRSSNMTTDATYIYFADYGDPTGGPQVYRSSDGSSWPSVFTFTGVRHVHAIAADPYNLGTVWVAMGDGVTGPSRYSTDSGATWTAIATQNGSAPQETDISFTSTDVWFADDSTFLTAVVVDKATKTWKVAAGGFHGNIAVPGKTASVTWDPASIANNASTSTTVTLVGARFGHAAIASFSLAVPAGASMTAAVTAADTITVTLTNNTGGVLDLGSGTLRAGITGGTFSVATFYGQVDPATEIFYCVTPQSSASPDVGLFAIFGKGAAPVLLDWGPYGNYGVFISGGRVYYGSVNRPLLPVSATT